MQNTDRDDVVDQLNEFEEGDDWHSEPESGLTAQIREQVPNLSDRTRDVKDGIYVADYSWRFHLLTER